MYVINCFNVFVPFVIGKRKNDNRTVLYILIGLIKCWTAGKAIPFGEEKISLSPVHTSAIVKIVLQIVPSSILFSRFLSFAASCYSQTWRNSSMETIRIESLRNHIFVEVLKILKTVGHNALCSWESKENSFINMFLESTWTQAISAKIIVEGKYKLWLIISMTKIPHLFILFSPISIV